MYIQPNSTIKILENIPLNKSYEHTVYYPDKDQQYDAFNRYTKYTLTNYSYQRSSVGTIKVELKFEDIYQCNYLLYKNTSYEDKWFYAFIVGVDYANENTAYVHYDIDVMQTWCYDYATQKSFIERVTVNKDTMFAYTQPEGLELGSEYRLIKGVNKFASDRVAWVVMASKQIHGELSDGMYQWNGMISGVYTGLYLYFCESEGAVRELINRFVSEGLEDAITAFYQCPNVGGTQVTGIYRENFSFKMQENLGGGYKPRNNKLYCYPFTYLEVYNTLGNSTDIKFDQFDNFGDRTADFEIDAVVFPQAEYTCTPLYYRGYSKDFSYTNVYGLFPTCAFAGDAFKAWWAQNKNSYMASLNAIGNTYDTNQAIAQNTYTMAGNSASNARTNAQIGSYTQLANSSSSVATELNNASRTSQYGYNMSELGYASAIAKTAALDFGGAIGTAIDATKDLAQNTLQLNNTTDSLMTQLNNASRSTDASLSIAGNNYVTAMKNATLAETNSHLSALNTYQNATQQLMAKKQDIQHLPNTAHGNANCDGLNYARGTAGFVFRQWGLSYENAQRIDRYFDRYGYAINTMANVPRLNGRPHWCYVKTVGVNITGKLNNSDLMTIKGIYDNGITTWRLLEEVGNYDLDNKVGE